MTPKPTRWFPANRGRIGAARTTRLAVEEALEGLELAGGQQVTADLARGAADVVDAARTAQDPRLWLAASTRLEILLAKLTATRGGGSGGGVESVGDDPAAELARLVGESPSVGDGA